MNNETKKTETTSKSVTPVFEMPVALTRDSAEKIAPGKGKKLFGEIALAGGFGDASQLGTQAALDFTGLTNDLREIVRAVFAKFGK